MEEKQELKSTLVNIHLELAGRPNADKTYNIYLRITQNRQHKKVKTSIKVRKKNDFNKKAKYGSWIRTSEPSHEAWNKTLKDEIKKAEDFWRELKESGSVSKEKIIGKIKTGEVSLSFIDFSKEYADRTYQAGNYNTYKKYITFLNKLIDFLNGKDLQFNEITTDLLEKFKLYLHSIPNLRNKDLGLHQNTISKQFDQFASLYNKGIKERSIIAKSDPFKGFECKTVRTSKEKLTSDEIGRIKNIDLEGGSLIWHCRNFFLFSYYCAGMRAGDLIQLRENNIIDGRLEYKMDKTTIRRSIKLLPEAIEILSHYMDIQKPTNEYIFPLLKKDAPYAKADTEEKREQLPADVKKILMQQINSKNVLINKYLGKIAKLAEINKKLTFHISRHSFANIARQKDANVFDISKALGHSSISITETYLQNFDTKSQDNTMNAVFNASESSKSQLLELINTMTPEELNTIINNIKTNQV